MREGQELLIHFPHPELASLAFRPPLPLVSRQSDIEWGYFASSGSL